MRGRELGHDLPGAADPPEPADADLRSTSRRRSSSTSRGMSKDEVRERALEILRLMGIPPTRYRSYPHEFSGGMRQRLMIALALVLRPAFVVADEPTTALDVLVEAQIIQILNDLRQNFDTALLLITHNLGIVAEACDRVAVMYAGRIVEQGDVARRLRQPAAPLHPGAAAVDDLAEHHGPQLHPRRAAGPRRPAAGLPLPPAVPGRDEGLRRPRTRSTSTHGDGPASSAGCRARTTQIPPGGTEPLEAGGDRPLPTKPDAAPRPSDTVVDIRDLSVHFELRRQRARAPVRTLQPAPSRPSTASTSRCGRGEVVGLVGESGSGKSTLGRALLGLVPATDGSIVFERQRRRRDAAGGELRELRTHMQMVFQDPNAALNPAMTIEQARRATRCAIHGMQVGRASAGVG